MPHNSKPGTGRIGALTQHSTLPSALVDHLRRIKSSFNSYRFVCLLIILLAASLRLYQADYNFSGDELFSVEAASSSFSHAIDVSIKDRVHPPLYYVLLHFWIEAFGNSETAVRSLSVLASVAFLVIVYALMS